MDKHAKPVLDRIRVKDTCAMLFGINITVTAPEIALGKDVQKDISGVRFKLDGAAHKIHL
jgi:hypothetical protein